jgi:hypothetical protein
LSHPSPKRKLKRFSPTIISKRKENVFVIRFNAPEDCRDTPKVKKLFSTYKKTDLEDYLHAEFMKIGNISSY